MRDKVNIDLLPEEAIKPVGRILSRAVVAQRRIGELGQPESIIQLAYRQQTAV
jgi:hypothetical protein